MRVPEEKNASPGPVRQMLTRITDLTAQPPRLRMTEQAEDLPSFFSTRFSAKFFLRAACPAPIKTKRN